jgi:hypothetical protein
MTSKCVYSKNKKNKRSLKKTLKKRRGKRMHKGGSAPACVNSPDVSKYMNTCASVNVHNTNPEANYSLIEGNGVLPVSTVMKGGSCTPISEQPNPLTFTDYLNRASKEISGGSSLTGVSSSLDNGSLEVEQTGKFQSQSGGSGYSINPEEMIGGLPSRTKYDSCCQPALLGNKLVFGNDGNSICGNQVGGKKHKTSKKSMKSNKSKKSMKSMKSMKSKKSKKYNKKGGFVSKYPFEGEDGDFGYLPEGKDFAGKQPYWNVNTR